MARKATYNDIMSGFSKGAPNTPSEPAAPSAPNTPSVQDTQDTPSVQDTQDTPSAPITPSTPTTQGETSTPNGKAAQPPTQSEPKKVKSYHDFVTEMEAARQLSPEQEMAMAKRRKRQSVASAIGDGLSALANLYFTTKYAPNVQGQGKLSEKNQARWDKWEAEMKASRKSYADAMRKAEQAEAELQRKKSKDDAELEIKRNADKRAQQLADANAAMKQSAAAKNEEMAKLYKAKADALIAGQEGEAKILDAKIREAEAKVKLREAQVETEKGKPAVQKSQIEKNRKTGDAAVTRANKSGSRSSSTSDKESWETFYQIYNTPDGREFAKAYARNNNLNVGDNDKTDTYGLNPSDGRSSTWSDKKNRDGMVNAYRAWKKTQAKPAAKNPQESAPKKATTSKTKTPKLKNTAKLGL